MKSKPQKQILEIAFRKDEKETGEQRRKRKRNLDGMTTMRIPPNLIRHPGTKKMMASSLVSKAGLRHGDGHSAVLVPHVYVSSHFSHGP
jgi:hypothetical protein